MSETFPRVAYVGFDTVGTQLVDVPLAGRYLHMDGVMGWLRAEAEAWDAAALKPEGSFSQPPLVCAQVAAALRGIAEREWGER